MTKDVLVSDVKCHACGAANNVDFHAANVEILDDEPGVFYLTCKWGKCNHRGEDRFVGDLKPLYQKKE